MGGRTEATPSGLSLAEVRERIDAVDGQILALLAERQGWVLAAGSLKKDEETVRDPGRVEQVIARMRQRAEDAGASPEVAERTYRAMIAAFIDLELTRHHEHA